MFKQCNFIIGKDNTVIITVPTPLPSAETYTISVSDRDIAFRADTEDFACFDYVDKDGKIFKSMMQNTQVGLVEFVPDGAFPTHIDNLAYVELRRAH